jgi:hypothetical protein
VHEHGVVMAVIAPMCEVLTHLVLVLVVNNASTLPTILLPLPRRSYVPLYPLCLRLVLLQWPPGGRDAGKGVRSGEMGVGQRMWVRVGSSGWMSLWCA